nr:polyprotein [Triticum mosaic virus]
MSSKKMMWVPKSAHKAPVVSREPVIRKKEWVARQIPKYIPVSNPGDCRDEISQTLLHFDSEEAVYDFVWRFPMGSIFWDTNGRIKPVVNCLLRATRMNLDYDVAADVYVCRDCLSCASSYMYFSNYHYDCRELRENHEAVVSCKYEQHIVSTFDVFPRYCTQEIEQNVVNWMTETLERYDNEPLRIEKQLQFYNHKTEQMESRVQEVQVTTAEYAVSDTYVPQQLSLKGSVSAKLTQRRANKIIMRTHEVENLIRETIDLCDERQIPITFVDVKHKRCLPRIPLRHMQAKPDISEIVEQGDMYNEVGQFIEQYQNLAEPFRVIRDYEVTRGWSGVILHRDDLALDPQTQARCLNNLFVVMGRCEHGHLQNALRPDCLEGLTYYSDTFGKVFNESLVKHHPGKHQFRIGSRTDYEWEELAMWVNAVCPVSFRCADCRPPQSLNEYIENIRMSKAMAELAGRQDALSKTLHKWTTMLISSVLTTEIRARDNLEPIQERIFTRNMPLGPLYDVAGAMNRAVIDIQTAVQNMQQSIGNSNMNEQQRNQTLLNEINKIKQHSFMQTKEMLSRFENIAQTYQNIISSASQPLSIHSMRQLMMDSRMDESFEFDIMRKKGSIASIAPMAFRTFEDIYSQPGVYNQKWLNLTPSGRFQTDIDYLRLDLPIDVIQKKKHVVNRNEIKEETCYVIVGQVNVSFCEVVARCFVPIPHVLRVGSPQNPTMIKIQDQEGGKTLVPKSGFCYVLQLVLMLGYVPDQLTAAFVKDVGIVVESLGPWPLFVDYLGAIKNLIIRYPTTIKAPTALHIVDHVDKVIHVMTTLGCVNKGEHYLTLQSVAQLHDAAMTVNIETFKDYRIGGVVPQLKHMLQSEEHMLEVLEAKPQWLVHLLLSPTQIWALSQSVVKYQVIHKVMTSNPDLAVALAQLVAISSNFSIFKNTEHVIQKYFEVSKQLQNVSGVILGEHNEYFETAFAQYSALRFSTDVVLLMDQFSTRKKTLDDLEDYYRKTIPSILIECGLLGPSDFGWRKRLVRGVVDRGSGLKSTVKSLGGFSTKEKWISWSGLGSGTITCVKFPFVCLQRSGSWLYSSTKTTAFNAVWMAGIKCVKSNVRSILLDSALYGAITLALLCAIKLIRKAFRFVEGLIKEDTSDDEDYVLHAKAASDSLYIQCLAWLALVVGCFNSGLANDIYFSTTKYRTLLDMVKTAHSDSFVFHAGDEEEGEIVELITRDNFVDYVYNHSDPLMEFDSETLLGWYTRISYQGRVLEHPLRVGTNCHLTRENVDEIAKNIATGAGNEFIVVGDVGSGKSTKLPIAVSTYGPVLILVPSRELVNNLCSSIWHVGKKQASTYMMNCITRGTSNISIMTYGYALALFSHCPIELQKYRFIQMDECHEFSSHMITFYSWWRESGKFTKLFKTTATPPGTVIKGGCVPTNHKVDVIEIRDVSVEEFCRRSIDSHAEGLRSLMPNGGRVIMFVPSRRECELARSSLISIPGARTWVVYRAAATQATKLVAELADDRHYFQIIITTTVLQNGVNLDPDCVVDFGQTFEAAYDRDSRQLGVRRRNINPGELIQRVGRVGRNKPGKFIQVGKRLEHEVVPNSCCVTDAILMSFTLELAPFISSHLIDEVNFVTREQVRTAMKFSAPLLFMIHYVRRDGRMLNGYYQQLKGLLLQTSDVALCDTLVGDAETNSFLTLRQYQLRGIIEAQEVLPDLPIPFYSSEFALPFYLEIGQITKEAIRARSFTLRIKTPDVKKAVMRLSTSATQIDQTIGILRTRLQLTRERLSKFSELKATAHNLRLTPIFNTCFDMGAAKSESTLRASLTAGEELLSALELARTEKSDKALEKLILDNPVLGDCLVFHGGPEEYFDQTLFQTSTGLINKYTVGIACLTVGLGCTIWYYLKKREKYVMHGKVHTRETGLTTNHLFVPGMKEHIQEWTGGDHEIGNRFGEAYKRRFIGRQPTEEQKLSKEKWDKREGQQTSVYKTLYDLDPTKFKYVVVECPDFDLKKKLNRQEKKQLDTTIVEACRTRMLDKGQHDFKDVERATVYLFNDNGVGHKVQLTPHNPLAVSRTTTHPVGFPAEAGRLRQTGQAMEMTPEELEKALDDNYVPHSRCQIDISHLHRHLAIVNTGGMSTQCFITQTMCVAPYHLAMGFKDNTKLTIYCSNGVYVMPVPKVEKMENMDLVVFRMPQDFPPLKRCATIREPKSSDEVTLITGKRTTHGIQLQFSKVVSIDRKSDTVWKYMIDSVPGVCGGMVMCVEDGCVVGFHSAAAIRNKVSNGSIFTPVTPQLLDSLQSSEGHLFDWYFNDDLISWKGVPTNMDPRNFPVSETISEFIFHNDSKGHGTDKYYGENLTIEGRVLQSFNTRHVVKGLDDAFAEYVNKFGEPPADTFTHLPSDLSSDAFYKDFMKYSTPVEVGTVNIENFEKAVQAVVELLEQQGFEQGEFSPEMDFYKILNSFNLDTAMGALYQCKKKDVLPMASHEQLATWFWNSLENLATGKLGLWKASLKAELRPKEKVLEKKTRVFTAAPFDVSFGAKAFVDDFNNKFYATQAGSNWTVGINKFNCGWDELARRFNPDWKFIDADGSRYDSSLTPLLFNAVLRIRQHFLRANGFERRMLSNFYTQLVWTPISTITGQIVKKNKGGPSGQPSTVVDNTMMLMIAVEYAKLQYGVTDLKYVCNGDDLILNAPQGVCETIRANFSHSFKELGLTYEFEQEVDSIDQVEYMSHKWIDCGGVLIPKLKPERIVSVLQWNKSLDLASQANKINAAWIESFGYGDLSKFIREYANWWGERNGQVGFLCSEEKVASLYLTNDVTIHTEEHDEFVFHSGADQSGVVKDQTGDKAEGSGTKTEDPPNQTTDPVNNPSNGGNKDAPQNLNATVVTKSYTYIPPIMKSLVTIDTAKKMADYTPPDALISTQACTLEQFGRWANAAANGLGLSMQAFQTDVVPYWIYWCIVNSASDEHKKLSSWTKVNMTIDDATGQINLNEGEAQTIYEMSPMFDEAKPTLRAVMRHFGALAYRWVKFSIAKRKPIIPHNAIKAGLMDVTYFPCCIDFVTVDQLSPQEQNVRNQVINARVSDTPRALFKHAQRAGAGEEDTNLRRDDDANYGRTRVGGAMFGTR